MSVPPNKATPVADEKTQVENTGTEQTKLMQFMEAIRTNNRERFATLLQDKTFDINFKLSLADGEKLLPGYMLYREENNPLLFALSLERMDFATQLLADSRINLQVKNKFGLNILHMLAFVNDTYEYTDTVTNDQSNRIAIELKMGAEKVAKAIEFLRDVGKKAGYTFDDLLNARVTECQRTPIILSTEGPVSLELFSKFLELVHKSESYGSLSKGTRGNIFHEIGSHQKQRLDIIEKMLEDEETRGFAIELLLEKNTGGKAAWELLKTPIYKQPDSIPLLNAVILKCRLNPTKDPRTIIKQALESKLTKTKRPMK
ncbi:MAG TPA: hypothetical protein VNK03_04550 [Gammaproteobacteria bacterium]|nr:hypothetical protein [Gammaproteobacteria bacterium]